VIKQLEHLKTYPIVQKKLKDGALSLHGWWFELKQADVYAYEEPLDEFVKIDEEQAARILERVKK
jgi:carbonic anhydrase